MDMQGTPIGNSATGTKNTSVPAPPIQEGPGAIAKDSLAAESSAFPDQYTQKVSGSNSTFNNTDTSSATELPPAKDASERVPIEEDDRIKGSAGSKYPEALGKVEFDGMHSNQGYVGGPKSGSSETNGHGVYKASEKINNGENTESSGLTNADPAPSYVTDVYAQGDKPKGKGLKEGGFEEDAPNASFTTDIGSENDPGREGIAKFQRQFAGDAADAGLPKTQKNIDNETPYRVLPSDISA